MDRRKRLPHKLFLPVILLFFFLAAPAIHADEYPDDIVIQNQSLPPGEPCRYIADQSITAGPTVTVEANAKVILAAGNRVAIMPGFTANRCQFSMFINKDIDTDSLFDWWETSHFRNLDQDSNTDFDRDGLTNLQEFQKDLDPVRYNSDNDQDGISDAWELLHFGTLAEEGDQDYDNDSASNLLEFIAGTNPASPDEVPEDGIHYGYDELGRLISVIELSDGMVDLQIRYQYDVVGNVTRRIIGAASPETH